MRADQAGGAVATVDQPPPPTIVQERAFGNPSVAATCCDFYGNAGGDWVGCVAGMNGVNGNQHSNSRPDAQDHPTRARELDAELRIGTCPHPCRELFRFCEHPAGGNHIAASMLELSADAE